ncbi:AraC family transcriptional regulator [Caballeronia udeis]|uniref:AraC family transcriptional regulator n=1 Tax=Caballeronia udeis TaxID=1232866 RepID=A0A158GLK2_9BURK|nr:helix-turn-helix transcriptional regulator [Caballeronia udeis]SAL32813.1 AraC family transcriptional regulator [Caballeronia udeis]
MFSDFYFPLISCLASPSKPPGIWPKIRDGRILSASADLGRVVQDCGVENGAAYCVQLHADLELVMGMDSDAEESYRQARKISQASKSEIRVLSARNTGWQALYRRRFGTAMACFLRVAKEPGVDLPRRIEALFGTMSVLFELGHLNQVGCMLDEIELEVDKLRELEDTRSAWCETVQTMRADLTLQCSLRHAPQLSDHVYWHSGQLCDPGPLHAKPGLVAERLLLEHDIRLPVLCGRLEYKESLGRLVRGQGDAITPLLAHLDWADANSLTIYQRTVRFEIALASLIADLPQVAQMVLGSIANESHIGFDHRHLEALYCLAKINQAQGRVHHSRQLYIKYAMVAIHCAREGAAELARGSHQRRGVAVADDVTARLPAKYRRAYQYLLNNLERSDLSIHEIAAEIGVTVRALQNTFKAHLGATPSEIIRQQRMKRIQQELEDDRGGAGQKVHDAGNRWGVPNRSTLLNAYKRQFNEAPSDTLNRREPASLTIDSSSTLTELCDSMKDSDAIRSS